jgi:hypothetical protein
MYTVHLMFRMPSSIRRGLSGLFFPQNMLVPPGELQYPALASDRVLRADT